MESVVLNQITSSAVVILLLNKLKSSSWFPSITQKSDQINRVLAVLLAGLGAIGVHTSFDHAAGILTITGLTTTGILTGLWHWVTSYATQELAYQATKKAGSDAATKP